MNIRRSVATMIAAGALVSGVGSAAAFADTTTTAVPAATVPVKGKHCEKAADKVAKLTAELTKLDARLDTLQKERATAVAAHKDELVKKLDARIDKLHKHHVEIEGRVDALRKACDLK